MSTLHIIPTHDPDIGRQVEALLWLLQRVPAADPQAKEYPIERQLAGTPLDGALEASSPEGTSHDDPC